MKNTLGYGLIALFLLAALPPLHSARADTGPKPGMEFRFTQQFTGAPVTIISGELLECEQADCSDAKPLPKLGPQGLYCESTSCSALAYGFDTYHRLTIQFSDGVTRESNIFKTAGFKSTYDVTIREKDLVVKSRFALDFFSPYTYILICGVCLAGIIILVMVIIFLVRRSKKK